MIITYIIFCATAFCGTFSLKNEIGYDQTFENCKIAFYQKKFDILPGRGWDNLNNEPMGQVLNLNFSKCKYSQDNIYLIPNDVSIIPTKISEVILNAKHFSHFANYTTVTAESINFDVRGSVFSLSFLGSFSKEKEHVKSDQVETKSSSIRVQLRYNVFKSISEADAELHPTFRNRIIDIAGLVLEGKDNLYPEYLADMIVRDYGTHVIKSIDAGAVLSKIDSLSSSYTKKYKTNPNKISNSASASFLKIFEMSKKYSNRVENYEIDEYDQSCQRTRIETHGGTLYGANFSLDEWRLSISDNMVPIDRNGKPIYYVLTPRSLSELDHFTVNRVYNLVKDAVERYYSANARPGCLDLNSKNFNPDANIDGKNCEYPKVTFNFGGAFQTCSGPANQCGSRAQVNPLTGWYSCPENYQSILLNGGLNMCRDICYAYFIFWTYCDTDCSHYKSYWCAPTNLNGTSSGYRFGGFISNQMKTCPLKYFTLTVGLSAQMCVSTNNDPIHEDEIKFGGFYSCSVGNPLAADLHRPYDWPNVCAKGYVAHIASIDQGCAISYCAETNKISLGTKPLLVRPPFISLNYNPNSTKAMLFLNADGKLVLKENKNIIIIIISTLFGIFFVTSLLFGIFFYRQRKLTKKEIDTLQSKETTLDASLTIYETMKSDEAV